MSNSIVHIHGRQKQNNGNWRTSERASMPVKLTRSKDTGLWVDRQKMKAAQVTIRKVEANMQRVLAYLNTSLDDKYRQEACEQYLGLVAQKRALQSSPVVGVISKKRATSKIRKFSV